jgi:hypothetical protein
MPRYNNPRRTWQYTNEFKVKAVQLSLIEGIQVKSVAETLDIHPFMLSRWRKEYRAGQCTDNAHMESFFHSMKAELIRGNLFNNVLELRYAVGNYINKYYNAKRLHSGIDYCSPIEYKTLAA